jgi:hypothetical protein
MNYIDQGSIVSRAIQYTGLPAVSVTNTLDVSQGYDMSIWRNFCERVPTPFAHEVKHDRLP